MTLTEFLLARIAADEELAQTAIRPEEMHPWGDRSLPQTSPAQWADEVNGYLGGPWGEHCGNWNPLRVLAECAAKRRMVTLAAELDLKALDSEPWVAEQFLIRLAAPYADHPDYPGNKPHPRQDNT